jgi:hypothetical protein
LAKTLEAILDPSAAKQKRIALAIGAFRRSDHAAEQDWEDESGRLLAA